MFISQTLQYKVQKDLQMYYSKEIESVFIVRLFRNKPCFLMDTIYKHPTMQNYKFNIELMENLIYKINLNLIKCRQNRSKSTLRNCSV